MEFVWFIIIGLVAGAFQMLMNVWPPSSQPAGAVPRPA